MCVLRLFNPPCGGAACCCHLQKKATAHTVTHYGGSVRRLKTSADAHICRTLSHNITKHAALTHHPANKNTDICFMQASERTYTWIQSLVHLKGPLWNILFSLNLFHKPRCQCFHFLLISFIGRHFPYIYLLVTGPVSMISTPRPFVLHMLKKEGI